MTKYLLTFLLLTGCSSFNKYRDMKKPLTKFDGIEITKADLKGAQLLFKIEVENPNDFALKVDSVKYQIEIGGKTMSTESLNTPTEVAGKSKSVVQLPLTLAYADVFTSIGDFLRNEKTAYRIKGSARVGIFSLPFDEKGEFNISDGEVKHQNK